MSGALKHAPVQLAHLGRKWLCILLAGAGFYTKPTGDDPLEVIRSTVREEYEAGRISLRDIHDALVCQENEARAAIPKATT